MNEVWKVCRVEDDGVWQSAMGDMPALRRHGMDLEYWLRKETVALEGTVGIVCFSTQEGAEEWAADHLDSFAVLQCTTDYEPEPIGVLLRFSAWHLWQCGKGLLRGAVSPNCPTMPAPLGAVTVPGLTPVECIWRSGDG